MAASTGHTAALDSHGQRQVRADHVSAKRLIGAGFKEPPQFPSYAETLRK